MVTAPMEYALALQVMSERTVPHQAVLSSARITENASMPPASVTRDTLALTAPLRLATAIVLDMDTATMEHATASLALQENIVDCWAAPMTALAMDGVTRVCADATLGSLVLTVPNENALLDALDMEPAAQTIHVIAMQDTRDWTAR